MRTLIAVSVAAALACAAVSSVALAGPRDTATFTNVETDIPSGVGDIKVLAAAGGYNVKSITVTGTLTHIAPSSGANETLIQARSPAGRLYMMQPFRTGSYSGSISASYTYELETPEVSVAGNWNFYFLESINDTGADAMWTTVTITLNDGPPAATDVGQIDASALTFPFVLAPNETKWIKFSLASPIAATDFKFLDIDTEGSTLGGSDTVLALYDAKGQLVAFDDDDGSGNWSQMSFGQGTRSAVGGLAYDGRDGSLAAGTYYLGVRSFGGPVDPLGWGFYRLVPDNDAGLVKVNIRTNAPAAGFCRADFNRDGTLAVQDIFDYLSAWFAGCQ